jgi:hypothetical protein
MRRKEAAVVGNTSDIIERSGSEASKRTSDELVKLVRKLRWIGVDQEAQKMQLVLRQLDPSATLFGEPVETD